MNKKLAVAFVFIGLFIGYAISTVVVRLAADPLTFRVHVEGEFGSPVTVTATGKFGSDETQTFYDIVGEGREVVEGEQALIRITYFTSDGSVWSQVADLPTIRGGLADEASLQDALPYVLGQPEGSRLVVVTPVETRLEITVIDILYTQPDLSDAEVIYASGGLPTVSYDDYGYPLIEEGGGAITDMNLVAQVAGNGTQVTLADTVFANYMLVSTDGYVLESTYAPNTPLARIVVEEVFPGLEMALVDQRVGSRLVVAVPAAQAQGDTDLAIVIDILALAD
ncbi:MAG: FKBP-type peptidyl-prolyl cis-trans isomerase [Actinomycetaceae bacterium]|nr:FKBP-type peptidyl-prolyl cis-trans isomerase [Actinomycetaceae bacterium]